MNNVAPIAYDIWRPVASRATLVYNNAGNEPWGVALELRHARMLVVLLSDFCGQMERASV